MRWSYPIGYGRVSVLAPECEQRDILSSRGCSSLFFDEIGAANQPGLHAALSQLAFGRDEPTLVVCALPRLAPNLTTLIALIKKMQETGVSLVSLEEHWDCRRSDYSIPTMISDLAAFSRSIAAEKARMAITVAIDQTKLTGRPRRLDDIAVAKLKKQVEAGEPVSRLAKDHKISIPTLYRYLSRKI
jgi:DNA invertase Pin-like site-specific DNA recombinase